MGDLLEKDPRCAAMPDDLCAESDRQRAREAASLRARADAALARDASSYEVEFRLDLEDPETHPETFARAARTAAALDDRGECRPNNLERVQFSPRPDKYAGAWLVHVSFNGRGPWSGKEWVVPAERLFEAWARAK